MIRVNGEKISRKNKTCFSTSIKGNSILTIYSTNADGRKVRNCRVSA